MTSEKKRVASLLLDETFTLTCEGPTMLSGCVSGSVSKKPLCPGKNAADTPPIFPAKDNADPTPGSDEIAPGIPPIGAMRAAKGVVIGIVE